MTLFPPMLLSTGRVVLHSPMAFGISQRATPTPGPAEMTPAEWLEYCDKVRKSLSPPKLKCPQCGGRHPTGCCAQDGRD